MRRYPLDESLNSDLDDDINDGLDEVLDEVGHQVPEELIDRPNAQELKEAVEMLVYLEQEFGIDTRRIRIRVRNKSVHIQGNVDSGDLKKSIESWLQERNPSKEIQNYLGVNRN